MIRFSIIVPVYNSENYLDKCLNSIYKQEYKNFEAIIVDDGSTDNSKGIAEKYERKDPRFKYLYKRNEGPALARNLGLKVSKGDYVCFIDSDDELLPDYFTQINNVLVKEKVSILEINAFYQEASKENLIKYQHLSFDEQIMSGSSYLANFLVECSYFNVVPWTKIINRDFIFDNNLLFENIYAEDELWARKLFLLAPKVMFLDKCLYLQHRRNNSQSKKKYLKKNVEDQKKTYFELEKLYRKHINDSKKLNILLDELSHNFVAVSLLNVNVKVTYKDKLFAVRNAKSFANFCNALLFTFSPKLRKIIKGR